MLDENDRKILFELDLNCRTPAIEIAEKLQLSRQAVDYRIKKLSNSGVIQNFHACINLGKLGYRLYRVHLKLTNLPERLEDLRKYIYSLGNVYWVGKCSGRWDLLIGLFYHDQSELFPITNRLSTEYSDLIVEIQGNSMVRILQYPKNFLINACSPPKEYIGKVTEPSLRKMDMNIIAELIRDARAPITILSKKIGSSYQKVKRRIEYLESENIIFQYRIGIDLNKLDLQLYKATIRFQEYSAKDHKDFSTYISKIPSIQFFVRNLWTIELELNVKNYKEYRKIIQGIRSKFPHLIRDVDTLLLESDEWTPGFTNFLS